MTEAMLLAADRPNGNTDTKAADTPVFDRWLNDFFDAYYRHRPVSATFIGVHRHDHRLPDLSENGAGDTVAAMRDLLVRAARLPNEPHSASQRIDRRLAEGFLRIQRWEFDSGRFHLANPSLYTGEAIFGVLSLLLTDFAPRNERVAAATERLRAIPTLLDQAKANIRSAPEAWTRTAIAECDGALEFLAHGAAAAAGPDATEGYANSVEAAARAFGKFRTYLGERLAKAPIRLDGCGEEALRLHLIDGHCIEQDADDIAAYAEAELEEATSYLAAHCRDFGDNEPDGVLEKLRELHPSADEYYGRYRELSDEIRSLAEENALLSWPDFPLRYVPQPTWIRGSAPYLYFLAYRSPAAFGRPAVHDYLVAPIDAAMSPADQQALLRENNDSVIKLNHVVHHGGIGHHVQNWHAFRAASRIGRIAAVDCASRIAMNCGGTMAEGWACYATDLIGEAGGLTDLEAYAEFRTRQRMCARAIVDVRLHQGRMTPEQAAGFYERRAHMSESSSLAEATRNSMYPGSALMYLVGTDAIHALRAELSRGRGNRFSLREFHDRFLSFGSIPVPLIATAMLEEDNQKAVTPEHE